MCMYEQNYCPKLQTFREEICATLRLIITMEICNFTMRGGNYIEKILFLAQNQKPTQSSKIYRLFQILGFFYNT